MPHALSLEDQTIIALRRITRAINLHSRVLLQDYGLTAPQLGTLRAIARHQPVKIGTIAKEIHVGQPTVTGILNRLESRGLVERVRGESDRRSVHVSLTNDGQKLVSEAPSMLQDVFRGELGKLPTWEQTQILANLQRIADMMHAKKLKNAVLGSELPAAIAVVPPPLHIEEPLPAEADAPDTIGL